MIIYENEKFLRNIKRNGIKSNDKYANFKIRYLMFDLCANTSYRKGKIINTVKDIASDYFVGLPDELIYQELSKKYDICKVQKNQQKWHDQYLDKNITLYRSEMETIANLQDEKLMRLAFASLIVFKYKSQFIVSSEEYREYITACDADIYRLAEFDGVSSKRKKQLWKMLHDLGLVEHINPTNKMWKYKPEWIAVDLFKVNFCADLHDTTDEIVYKKITNYDQPLLYLDYFIGKEGIKECAECGCPILNSANRKCLCSNCAETRKKSSKRASYTRQNLPS